LTPRTIHLAHSPDSDDAFMFAGLAAGAVAAPGLAFVHELHDIETLNRAARDGRYELTALSFHAYPYVAERYDLLDVGASFGDGYGPVVVAREALDLAALKGRRVAIPGVWTTAALALRLAQPEVETAVVPFDRIGEAVLAGEFEAGVLIHEGQLTYADMGLHKVVDLGAWWKAETGLPLPLGGNGLSRALDEATARAVARALKDSISWGLSHRTEALDRAAGYARGLDRAQCDRFVGMYVNSWTEGLGEPGRHAVEELLARAAKAALIPPTTVRWIAVS